MNYNFNEEFERPFEARHCFDYEKYMHMLRGYATSCGYKYLDGHRDPIYWAPNAPVNYMPPFGSFRCTSFFLNPLSDHVDYIMHLKKGADGHTYTIDSYTEVIPFVNKDGNKPQLPGYSDLVCPLKGEDADHLARVFVSMRLIAKWDHEDKTMDKEKLVDRVNKRSLMALHEWAEYNINRYPGQIHVGCTVKDGDRELNTYYVNPIAFNWMIAGMLPIAQHDDDSVVPIPHFLYPSMRRFGLKANQCLYIGLVKSGKKAQMEANFRYFLMNSSHDDYNQWHDYPIYMGWMPVMNLVYYIWNNFAEVANDNVFNEVMHSTGNIDFYHDELRKYIMDNYPKFHIVETDESVPYDYLVL